jgi:hypothetical protein
MVRESLYPGRKFPKQEHGKATKIRVDPIRTGQKVRKSSARHIKHTARGSTTCKMSGCGGVYHVGSYYEHSKTLRHVQHLRTR